MLPKLNRLKKKRDFEILFNEGRFFRGALIDMKVWKIDPKKYPKREYSVSDLKIGFVVSTKVDKRAVNRNRVKRQMREVVRLLLLKDSLKNGYMMAFIARGPILKKTYADIQNDIVGLMQSANLLI